MAYLIKYLGKDQIVVDGEAMRQGTARTVETLTTELIFLYDAGLVTCTPAPGTSSGGSVGSESDPTVTTSLNNAFGVATGLKGKGTTVSVVTVSDLDTVFDVGDTTPNVLGIKTFAAQQPGIVPPCPIGEESKFLRGDGTFANGLTLARKTFNVTANGITGTVVVLAYGQQSDVDNAVVTVSSDGGTVTIGSLGKAKVKRIAFHAPTEFINTSRVSINYPDPLLTATDTIDDLVLPTLVRYNGADPAIIQPQTNIGTSITAGIVTIYQVGLIAGTAARFVVQVA